VTSPRAVELFVRVLGQERVVAAPVVRFVPRPISAEEVAKALAGATHVVFVSGAAAYRLAEVLPGAGALLAGRAVATAEGAKGAVMVKNKFGVEAYPGQTWEEVATWARGCGAAVVFHHGEFHRELAEALEALCRSVAHFQLYDAVPEDLDKMRLLVEPGGDVYVFFSGVAVEYAVENPYGLPVAERLRHAVNVAAGPAVAKALAKYGIEAVVPPSGRLGDVVKFVASLIRG